jgi:hypothetical protein
MNNAPSTCEFDFTGTSGVTITASHPDYSTNTYGFTIMRDGTMAINCYTDLRNPLDANDDGAADPLTGS